ncbi:trihelix transcription factor GT-2-like [Quercus lobata]|uniref:Myb-like domain-containing protein n=1 Tax=Quercus lobata TaxID=97700 RepID=A0A7N2KU52_QUELO|nr:trihelix transcription factor GT-2-like [Quercus lobata]
MLRDSEEDTVMVGADHEGDKDGAIGWNSSEEDKGKSEEGGDRITSGGNRWPRPETLALLKIRLDMDGVFRDSNLKGPLWEEVSRKLAELGYHRNAKKCKEKFENVYKYHKRTKEGRTGKAEGKTYRFFDQLQALENKHQPSKAMASSVSKTTIPSTANPTIISHNGVSKSTTVPSTTNPTIISQSVVPPIPNPTIPPLQAPKPVVPRNPLQSTISGILFSGNTSTSSSTASDEELKGRCKKRRKWKDFFKSLAKEVIEKQEELQLKFLEAIEKHENERIVREDSWRIQEMARLNREHEMLVQERSTAAAKDAAVIAFLQKISNDNNTNLQSQPVPRLTLPPRSLSSETNSEIQKMDIVRFENNSTPSPTQTSSSRWPKAEVEALIGLRTSVDRNYQENGPKGPMWEDISAGMRRLGYNRSAKRCKEKWENINKYFKKVKESNKTRPEDSKTCPYFQKLDALYKEKKKVESSANSGQDMNNLMEPLMVQPEQQWPPQEDNNQQETVMEDIENVEKNEEDDENEAVDSEEEDNDGGGFEVVINKPTSMDNGE